MFEIRSVSSRDLGRQLHINDVKPDEDRFQAAFNRQYRFNNKPAGGFWTSTLDESTGASDWVRWCRVEQWGDVDNSPWWVVIPDWRLTLVEIDSYADLVALLEVARNDDADVGKYRLEPQIDFNLLRDEGYAGIHLTEKGNYECHATAYGQSHLNSWDVESTLWFDWCFTDVSLYQVLPMGQPVQEGVHDYA